MTNRLDSELRNRPDHKDGRAVHKGWQALKALQSVGGFNKWVIFAAVLLIVLTNALSGFVQDLISWAISRLQALLTADEILPVPGPTLAAPTDRVSALSALDQQALHAALAVATTSILLAALVMWLLNIAKQGLSEQQPLVKEDQPAPAIALIMFLSMPSPVKWKENNGTRKKADKFEAERAEAFIRFGIDFEKWLGRIIFPPIADAKFQIANSFGANKEAMDKVAASFDGANWRVNAEALRPHMYPGSRLKEVILIASSDTEFSAGSSQYLERSKRLLSDILSRHGCPRVIVGSCEGIKLSNAGQLSRLGSSVDFDDLGAVVAALYAINAHLKKKYNCTDADVLADISSGTKLVTAAGLAFATLVENRRVQYVNTNSFAVRSFDVTHQFPDEPR